jgi:hypothetical protein
MCSRRRIGAAADRSAAVALLFSDFTPDEELAMARAGAGARRLLELCALSGRELDRRFRAGTSGRLPDGPAEGVLMVLPGSPLARPAARLLRALAWQGKVFEASRGELVNRVSLFRIRAVRAKVYAGQSWIDGRPCIVLDYAGASRLAGMVRDEIREIEPGLWLGLVYVWGTRVMRFALVHDPGDGEAGDARR